MAESFTGMAEALRWKSLAGNSQYKYKGHKTQWQQWCEMMEMPVVLPHKELSANTLQLGAFPVFLFLYCWNTRERGNQRKTIASKISAIRWHHRALVGYEPETDAGHALLMQALKRLSKPVTKKHPLTARMLWGIFGLLDMNQSGHQLVWGLLLIGYLFLLRRGEFQKVDDKWEKYVLLFGDAQFYDGNERPCKVLHATMVGIALRGGKINSSEGTR
jgi:hypothetical protein